MLFSFIGKLNKQVVFASVLILVGVFGMVDTASANYTYRHDSRNDHFFESKRDSVYRHKHYDSHGYPYFHRHGDRHNYSHNHGVRDNRVYGNHRYYDDRRYYDNRRGYTNRRYNPYYGNRSYRGDLINKRQCFSYKVTSRGGLGGFRFQHDKDDFKRINNKTYRGEICGRSSVEFELSKLDPNVDVSIRINGRHFRYPAKTQADRRVNSWYRKYYSIRLR